MDVIRAMAMAAAVVMLAVAVTVPPASGQAVAAAGACTNSLLTSFTPCLAFISNGTGRGGTWSPPSAACCTGLAAVVNVSTSCAQLILAGQVAVGVRVNCTLAVALPKACNATISVSLKCKDAPAVAVSPRGPVAAAPPTTTQSPPSTTPNAPAPAPEAAVPAQAPVLSPPPSQGPPRSSAWRHGGRVSVLPALVLMLGVGAMMA